VTAREWLPIESCPIQTDYSEPSLKVLCYWADGRIELASARFVNYLTGKPVMRFEADFMDFQCSFFFPDDYLPTHWMPLPEPPK
jgi:hypothetical protein